MKNTNNTNTTVIKISNAAKAARETAKRIKFSDLSEREFYRLFVEGGEKAARHHLLMVQLADTQGKCPKCKADLTYVHQSALTEKLVCPAGCGQAFPPATRRLAGEKPMYEVTLTKRKKIDGVWKDTHYQFNPFSKNGYKLPAVFFLAWGLMRDYIPSNIWDPKDRSRLHNFGEVKRIMTALGINKFPGGNIGDQEITEIGQALVQLIKSPENGGVGKDFLGVVSVPKGVNLDGEVDWPKSIFDARINHKTDSAPAPAPEVDSSPAPVSVSEDTNGDFLSDKDVKLWFESYRKKDPAKAFPPKGFEEFLLERTDNPGISHLLMEIFRVVEYLKGFTPSTGRVTLDVFIDHSRAWKNFNIAMHLYGVDPKGSKKAILSVLKNQATPKELRVFLLRDKDLLEILKAGPQNGEVFFTVEEFRRVVKEKFHYDMSPTDVKEFFNDYLKKL